MRVRRSILNSNFISLGGVLNAVADCILIEDDRLDPYLSLHSKNDQSILAVAQKNAVRKRLANADAASHLILVLNRRPGLRPEWLELSGGIALRDETVEKQGLKWLVAMAQKASPDMNIVGHRWGTEAAALLQVNDIFQATKEDLIGFNINDLIQFLDQEGIRHTLIIDEIKTSSDFDVKKDDSPDHLVRKNVKRKGRVSPIEAEILKARAEVGEPFEPSRVWACLRKMAESNQYESVLRLNENNEIIQLQENRWVIYSQDALRQFLRRRNLG